jgi:hypothetical protein
MSSMLMVPDGFALNLEAVALRLCAPFCCTTAGLEDPATCVPPKLLTVDPSFCAVESGQFKRGGLHEQTCLLPPSRNSSEGATQVLKFKSFMFFFFFFFFF